MDEYSYISENGTVRQIRDLIAKAKDEEQDASIADLASSLSSGLSGLESALQTYEQQTDGSIRQINTRLAQFSIVYTPLVSQVINANPGVAVGWNMSGSQAGYYPIAHFFHYGNSPYITMGIEGLDLRKGAFAASGFLKSEVGLSNFQVGCTVVWLRID